MFGADKSKYTFWFLHRSLYHYALKLQQIMFVEDLPLSVKDSVLSLQAFRNDRFRLILKLDRNLCSKNTYCIGFPGLFAFSVFTHWKPGWWEPTSLRMCRVMATRKPTDRAVQTKDQNSKEVCDL
jgi:hypothetical protein